MISDVEHSFMCLLAIRKSSLEKYLFRPSSKNLQTINAEEGVEKREHSCTVGGNVN